MGTEGDEMGKRGLLGVGPNLDTEPQAKKGKGKAAQQDAKTKEREPR